MATRTVVTHVCDRCGTEGVSPWSVGKGNRAPRKMELCDSCAEPLMEFIGGRSVGLKKSRPVVNEESVRRRRRQPAK